MTRLFALLIAITVLAQSLYSASLPIQVVPMPSAAAKGNTELVDLIVRLSATDGTPRSGLVPPAFRGWTAKLLLSPRDFNETKLRYDSKDNFGRSQTAVLDAIGMLTIRNIVEIDRGVYRVQIAPSAYAKQQTSIQGFTAWAEGEYLFRMSVADGPNMGDVLGTFTIR